MSNATGTSEAGLGTPLKYLRSILIPGETLEAWAVQSRWFALTRRRLVLGATSGRLIALARPLLGGFDFTDIRWQDLVDVKMHVGVLAATLTLIAGSRSDLAIEGGKKQLMLTYSGLRKDEAEAIYRLSQTQFQAWREKRRIRELEELRARSGGISGSQLPGLAGPAAVGGAEAQSEAVRHLKQAKELLEARLISDAEYEALKAKIIAS
jgi:hypothetical protein